MPMANEPRPRRRALLTAAVFLVLLGALYLGFRVISGPLLIEAVRSEHYAAAKLLVLLGADVDARMDDDSARSSLHLAAAAGNTDIIHFLIRHGASVDLRATFGVTPRAEAQIFHQAEAERVLVTYGAQPVPPDLHVP
jgi:ankyrin repeat protein